MSKVTIACEGWKPLQKNTLRGFAKVRVVELDLVIHDVAIHQKNDRGWAQLPARPWIKDGAVVTDDKGKVQYSPLFEFSRREVADAFSRRVVEAVLAYAPDAFAEEQVA